MSTRGAVAYSCDGSLNGILCCIFESYTRRELPADVLAEGTPSFYPLRPIVTDDSHAARVWRSITGIGGEVADWVRSCWLSCLPEREVLIFRFIRMAYDAGASICMRKGDPIVNRVFRAVQAVEHEAHMYCGFVRFADYNGALAAEITPKGMVLPLLTDHFADRFANETFLIYDTAHKQALFHRPGEAVIRPVDDLQLGPVEEKERMFQTLWKRYYTTIAIEGRINPKCRMGHMPKRYWQHMPEMQDLCAPKGALSGDRTLLQS